MTTLTITYTTESPNTLIRSSRWNQNFNDISNFINGNNLDDTYNLKAGGITNTAISATAAIASTKLNLATVSQVVAMSASTFKEAQGANVASATTTTLGEDGNFFFITGTTTITSITAKAAGTLVALKFNGILTLTNGSNLKLVADYVTVAGDVILLQSDGTNWWEISRLRANGAGFSNLASIPSGAGLIPSANLSGITRIQIFLTSSSFVAPAGVTEVYVSMCGGGGGAGAGSNAANAAGGGGGGASVQNLAYPVIPTNSYTVTIGAGGIGGVGNNVSGTNGGNTIFDTVTVNGGSLSTGAAGSINGGAGGTATTNVGTGGVGSAGTPGTAGTLKVTGVVGAAGGNGFTTANNGCGGGGGASAFGVGAIGGAVAALGGSALANSGGGGGGGGCSAASFGNGGNGGSGICVVLY